jgi:hypothetical protein
MLSCILDCQGGTIRVDGDGSQVFSGMHVTSFWVPGLGASSHVILSLFGPLFPFR